MVIMVTVNEIKNDFLNRLIERRLDFKNHLVDEKTVQQFYDVSYAGNDVDGNKLLENHLIDEYICQLLSGQRPIGSVEKERLKLYIKSQNYRIKLDSFSFFSNPLFSLPNDVLTKVFNKDTIVSIRNYQKSACKKTQQILENYLDSEDIASSDFQFMLNFLNSNMYRDSDEITGLLMMTQKVLHKIINESESFDYEAWLLLLNFMNKEAESKTGRKAILYVSDYYADGKKWDDNSYGVTNANVILINKKMIEKFNFNKEVFLFELQEHFFHELGHVNQLYEEKLNTYSSRAFNSIRDSLFIDALIDSNNNDDSHNYESMECEIDARYFAVCELLKFSKEFLPLYYHYYKSDFFEYLSNERLSHFTFDKVDEVEGSYHMLPEKYNVVVLGDLVAEQPKMVTKYSILETFYHPDGHVKNLPDLLLEEASNTKTATQNDMITLYHDYITTALLDGDLSKLDLTNFPTEMRGKIVNNLFLHYINTLKMIDFPLKFVTKKSSISPSILENIGDIVYERLQVVNIYETFFDENNKYLPIPLIDKRQKLDPYRQRIFSSAKKVFDIDYHSMMTVGKEAK